jgi:hypothetical protein
VNFEAMPSGFWDYVHLGRSQTNHDDGCGADEKPHNLQDGLFQIATQTCNILVQVNNTNNINFGYDDFSAKYGNGESSRSSTQSNLFDLEQSVVLLQQKGRVTLSPSSTPTKVRFSRFSEYKRRLSVSNNHYH